MLQKRGRNNVMVKSFGSSRDEAQIARMVEQAREFIQDTVSLSVSDWWHEKKDLTICTSPKKFLVLGDSRTDGKCFLSGTAIL